MGIRLLPYLNLRRSPPHPIPSSSPPDGDRGLEAYADLELADLTIRAGADKQVLLQCRNCHLWEI